MKRSIVLAISMLLLAPSLDATSRQCIPSGGCPKDQKPPACCKPPPCEYFYELKVAKAIRHAFSLKVQRSALAVAKVDDDRGQAKYEANFNRDMRKAARRFANCAPSRRFKPTPILTAEPEQQCRITVYESTAEVDLDTLKANGKSCDELIDAEFAQASTQQRHCQADLERTSDRPLQERRWQDVTEIEAQIDSLETNLMRYWGACSIVADATTARRVAQAGLDALKKTPPAVKPAKRSAKGRAQSA
jgi:hypothetical protein